MPKIIRKPSFYLPLNESRSIKNNYGTEILTVASSVYVTKHNGYFCNGAQISTVPYTTNVNLSGTDYTIECWFKATSFATAICPLAKDQYGANYDWGIYIPNNTEISIYSNGTSTSVRATGLSLQTNRWYYVAITGVGSNTTIYLNGIIVKTGSQSLSNANTTTWSIGGAGYNNPNTFMNGFIKDIRITKQALTSGEVISNYIKQYYK
jgi:hypothetical protein